MVESIKKKSDVPLRIAYLTAGAAGMYCGSCMHDNALAKAMIALGHDAVLIPTYTPIQTDEPNISSQNRLFYGGLNVYLEQVIPLFRWLPNWADRFLSSPKLVGWIASRAVGTSPKKLGALTVSILQGEHGHQRKEVHRLCQWLKSLDPDVVLFSNLMIASSAPTIRLQLGCPVVVILQGDDIFLDSLDTTFREQAIHELQRIAAQVDLFVVHSQDYASRMCAMLAIDAERIAVVPLSIDTRDFVALSRPPAHDSHPPTIGYLARIAPEKGLHLLVDAFILLHQRQANADWTLRIAGWLGREHQAYWTRQQEKLAAAGLSHLVDFQGTVDRNGKLCFLQSIDVLCVPTVYQEPKGLFVLEALAAGVPYILPAHGAFPEMHDRIEAGTLFTPGAVEEISDRITELFASRGQVQQLGERGREYVASQASSAQEAGRMLDLLERLIERYPSG